MVVSLGDLCNHQMVRKVRLGATQERAISTSTDTIKKERARQQAANSVKRRNWRVHQKVKLAIGCHWLSPSLVYYKPHASYRGLSVAPKCIV